MFSLITPTQGGGVSSAGNFPQLNRGTENTRFGPPSVIVGVRCAPGDDKFRIGEPVFIEEGGGSVLDGTTKVVSLHKLMTIYHNKEWTTSDPLNPEKKGTLASSSRPGGGAPPDGGAGDSGAGSGDEKEEENPLATLSSSDGAEASSGPVSSPSPAALTTTFSNGCVELVSSGRSAKRTFRFFGVVKDNSEQPGRMHGAPNHIHKDVAKQLAVVVKGRCNIINYWRRFRLGGHKLYIDIEELLECKVEPNCFTKNDDWAYATFGGPYTDGLYIGRHERGNSEGRSEFATIEIYL